MRITGGRARGRVLRTTVQDGVRPTSARVREALFSMIGQDLSGQRVLDAFGGSGLLGAEAWSRGADVVVVERRPDVAAAIRRTGDELGCSWRVVVGDVRRVAPGLGRFTGVLADPPYADDAGPLLDVLGAVADDWLVYEADVARQAPPGAGPLALDRVRAFGGTALWIYRGADDDAR